MGIGIGVSMDSYPSKPIGGISSSKLEVGRVYPARREFAKPVYDDDDPFFRELQCDDDIRNEYSKEEDDVNPRPDNWELIREEQIGHHLIIELCYPNCTHYEGRKILLYRNTTLGELIITNKGLIDPHFSDNSCWKSPFARFEPTEGGWNWAVAMAEDLG